MAEHCGHWWTSSHNAGGWREHTCVRPTGHGGMHRCGCFAQAARPEPADRPERWITTDRVRNPRLPRREADDAG
jgi:hypothetical protein